MLAPNIPDVVQAVTVEKMDRAELIAHIRMLERQRSAWEYRVRTCEEKEQLWKNLMQDMSVILATTFQELQLAIREQAAQAQDVCEKMQVIAQKVEDM